MENETQKLIEFLKSKDVIFDKGLTEDEFTLLKEKYEIIFPPDLKALIANALPISESFPNWRNLLNETDAYLKESISHLEEGILFDIEKNNFWYFPWGDRPNDLSQALAVAKKELMHVPKMIRVYGHRYIPLEPFEAGNPIFSISQTDIIYYGKNLENYFYTEFIPGFKEELLTVKKIRFWSDLVEGINILNSFYMKNPHFIKRPV